MNVPIAEFENLKISALRKVKLVNEYIHDVTIGPNATLNQSQFIPKSATKPEIRTIDVSTLEDFPNNRSSIEKFRAEVDAQIQAEVQKSITTRFKKVIEASNKFVNEAKLAWMKKQEMLIEQSLKQDEYVLEALKEYDKKADDHVHQLEIEYQRQSEERQKRNLQVVLQEKQRQQLLVLVESIQKQQHAFILIYQAIVGYLNGCPLGQASAILSKYSGTLKSLSESIDAIRDKCKTGSVTSNDLEQIRSVVAEAVKLKEIVHRETLVLKKQAEEIKIQEEAIKVEAAKNNAINTVIPKQDIPLPASLGPVVTDQPDNVIKNSNYDLPTDSKKPILSIVESFISKSSLELYTKIQHFSEEYTSTYVELLNDPNLKEFRFNCKKAVNIPLNTISTVSLHHLMSKYQTLYNLLRGNAVEVAGTNIISSQHPQGVAFCTNLLAKKFVGQSDLITSESTHCYAAILVALWYDYPDFGKLVLAHFFEAVPYLVPMYPPKVKGQTDQEYYKSLGYLYVDGVREQQDKFLSRMSDYMRLYAAVAVTKLKKGQRGPHPHGLCWAWRWLANYLNLEPRVNITATLIFDFLEVAGNALQVTYGIQFQKILKFLNEVYLPKIQKIDSGGPLSRLQIFLQKVMKTGYIEPPIGRLPEGFW